MSKRFLFRCLLLLIVLGAVKKSLDATLGWVLAEVFSQGTGCEVLLQKPALHVFPPSMSVENVVIRHRSEPANAGFRARHISIRLDLGRLFQKEARLSDLVLLGTRADSDGTDTGFIQTFAFLFPPAKPVDPLAPPPGAFARWLKTWDFHITTIRIQTDDLPDQLRIVFKDIEYLWNSVNVDFIEQDFDSKKPYDLKLASTDFRVAHKDKPQVALGALYGEGAIGLGKLVVARGSLTPDATFGTIFGEGTILLKEPGNYALNVNGKIEKPVLDRMLQKALAPQNIPNSAEFTAKVSGSYLSPAVDGKIALRFLPGALIPGHPECSFSEFQTSFELNDSFIRLREIRLEDLLTRGELLIAQDGEKNVQGDFDFGFRENQRWVRACFSGNAGIPSEIAAAISDSTSSLSISGTLQPKNVHLKLDSAFSPAVQANQSKLQADATLTDRSLQVTAHEQGRVPQIIPIGEGQLLNRVAAKTAFRRDTNSNLDLDLEYSFPTKSLQINTLKLLRYPAERLLARFGPFLPTNTFDLIVKTTTRESLLDSELRGVIYDRRGEASGRIEVSNLNAFSLPVDKAALNLEWKDQLLQIKNLTLNALEGSLSGEASFNVQDTRTSAKLDIHGVRLGSLPLLEGSPLAGVLRAQGELSGTLEKLVYQLHADVLHEHAAAGTHSVLNIEGNSDELVASGTFLGRAPFELSWPIRNKENKHFRFHLEARDFPLVELSGVSSDEDAQSKFFNRATIRAHFDGPALHPLDGQGQIHIADLHYRTAAFTVEQNEDVLITVRGGKLEFSNVHLRAGDRDLRVTGFLDESSGWNAKISGNWDLSSFIPDSEALEQVSGNLSLDLSVLGPFREPRIEGPLALSDASLSFALGQAILGTSNVRATAMFQGDSLEVTSFVGDVGASEIRGTGFIRDMFDSAQRKTHAELVFRQMVLEPLEQLTLELTGNISFDGLGANPYSLSGNIMLNTGQYENNIKLAEVLRALTRFVMGTSPDTSEKRSSNSDGMFGSTKLDLRFQAPGGFLVDTNIVQAELEANLTLGGTVDQPTLEGSVQSVEGTFGLQSNEFELISGEAFFSRKAQTLDPTLSILGETTVLSQTGEEHHVKLSITGTLTNPEVGFSSDSGLRREQIQSLVGLGANVEALDFFYGGRKTRSFAELINPNSGATIEERLRGLTKFETVKIDTSLSPTTGEFVPRVVARRPVFRDADLDIQSELSGRRASSAGIDYELTPYLSFITGWRTSPITKEVSQGTGSLSAGFHYRSTFPGFRLYSPGFETRLKGLTEEPE